MGRQERYLFFGLKQLENWKKYMNIYFEFLGIGKETGQNLTSGKSETKWVLWLTQLMPSDSFQAYTKRNDTEISSGERKIISDINLDLLKEIEFQKSG